jgi:uncharacterized membrane protein YkvA (DUF1232 family)
MVKAQAKGLYKVPWRSLVLAVAGILYFLNPIDLIPDFIIGTGLLDDASVMLFVLRSLQKDITAYEAWEKQQSPDQTP